MKKQQNLKRENVDIFENKDKNCNFFKYYNLLILFILRY